jgi:hypothetical protein
LYVYTSSASVASLGIHVWRSIGGTAAPIDTGVFVASASGSVASVTPNYAVSAGDTLSLLATPGAPGKLTGSAAMLCQ